MPVYNPPNPYGGYFSFGQPESATAQTFGPMPFGVLSPGAQSMQGVGSGGFRPTSMEFLGGRLQEQAHQRYLADALRNDARVTTLVNAAMSNMGRTERKSMENIFGSRGNLQELIGWVMSNPGISSMAGGNPLAIPVGAYSAMSGGMRVNGIGMYNGDAITMGGAAALSAQISRQFYRGSGVADTSMTSGLNRDQIGGLMTMASAQGAFGGMNMGTLTQLGNKLNFNLDQSTMDKITKFVKSAAKFTSSLIDVYGEGSIAQLMSRATQITGLSLNQIGNAELIGQRLDALRLAGRARGIDTATMYDLAASGTAMGISMGLAPRYSGEASAISAARAAGVFRANQAGAGSFLTATSSLQEISGGLMRDQAAMARDPVGRRRLAMMLALESGHFAGRETEARNLMRMDGVSAAGAMDMFMRNNGLDMGNYTEMMGGPEGIQKMLSRSGMQDIVLGNANTVTERASRIFRIQANRALGGRTGGAQMMNLIESLHSQTLESAFGTLAKDPNTDISGIIGLDPAGRLDPKSYLSQIKAVVGGLGAAGAATAHRSLMQGISANTWLSKNFMSKAAQLSDSANIMGAMQFATGDRGSLQSGAFEGLLTSLAGDDARTAFVRGAMYDPGNIYGATGAGIHIPGAGEAFNRQGMFATARGLQREFGRTPEGKRALSKLGLLGVGDLNTQTLMSLHSQLQDTTKLAFAFSEFRMATFGEGVAATSQWQLRSSNENLSKAGGIEVLSLLAQIAKKQGDPNLASRLTNLFGSIGTEPVRTMDTAARMVSNLDMLSKVPHDDLVKIMRAGGPAFRERMDHFLKGALIKKAEPGMLWNLFGNKENWERDAHNAKVKKLEEAWKEGGGETGQQGAMTITGTLKLVGDALELSGGLKPSK